MKRSTLTLATLFTLIAPLPKSTAATILFDFGPAGSPTQSGWTAAPNGTGSDGNVSVTTAGLGSAFPDTRNRGSSSGGGAELSMWNDFVFGNQSFTNGGAPSGDGLEVTLTGLLGSTAYPITVWGYDALSGTDDRVAEWGGGGGSATLSFFGQASSNPTSLADHMASFTAMSDPAGTIVITGTPAAGGAPPPFSHNVFINGLSIGDPIPEPTAVSVALLGLVLLGTRRRR